MDDSEINSIAQGILLYLINQCKDPLDALSVILCLVLCYYEKAKAPNTDYSIEDFAKQFSGDMVTHWKTRTITAQGTDTVQ